jgi:transcriptional regulator with XRE-family HTH domain
MIDVVKNIIEIRKKKRINQETIADVLHVDVSVISNIEKRKRELKVNELEIIAKALGVDMLYLITYPDKYEKKVDKKEKEPVEAILQIKLQSEKKEQVMKLIFGEHNLEILNE